MLILLPPSEGKRPGGDGPPVDLAGLSWPRLTGHRERVAGVLSRLCERRPAKARQLLGLSPALDDDRIANAELLTSPTMLAGYRYAGVLHDALAYPTLPASARRRADELLVTFSGLWGATRPTDLVPAYRLGIGTVLPRIGPLPSFWRTAMCDAFHEQVREHGAIDLRSTGYTTMYRPSDSSTVLAVRLLRYDEQRAAASYASKVAKGLIAANLLRAGTPTVRRLLAAARAVGLASRQDGDGVVVIVPDGWPAAPILRS